MTVFFNFFLKTFAFLSAITIFVIFVGFLVTLFRDTNLGNNKYVLKLGASSSLNKIVLITTLILKMDTMLYFDY